MESGTVLNQQELFLLVKQEAENLKVHATQEELSNLSFDKLDPIQADKCIYGLMTGNCYSKRSIQLIELCCERVIVDASGVSGSKVLNGSPSKSYRRSYWSPIEVYIAQDDFNSNNKSLVAFLRSETDTLTFTPTETI